MAGVKQKTPMHKGFTIIEVMIFLAISGVTFLIAASFINGKEAQVEFRTGMTNANGIIQTLINDVADGSYPLAASQYLSCDISSVPPIINNPVSTPPDHPDCALIGKIIAPENSSNTSSYSIYSVAGCQYYVSVKCATAQQGGLTPTNINEEHPALVSLFNQSHDWPGGISISKLFIVSGAAAQRIGAFGVFSSLPQMSGNVLVSGAQAVQAVYLPGSHLYLDSDAYIKNFVNSNSVATLPNNSYIVMCFLGSNNHKASITIGGVNSGGQLSSTLQTGTIAGSTQVYSGC